MIHTIILITLVYAAIRAIFKRKPYQIQLVSRPSAAHDSGSTIEESTRLMHEQFDRSREMALASRDRIDAHRAKQYHADCAKMRAMFERNLGN